MCQSKNSRRHAMLFMTIVSQPSWHSIRFRSPSSLLAAILFLHKKKANGCLRTDGRQLPTLTSFIASPPTGSPFRVSIHSWTKPKPSPGIEAKRKAHQKVVFAVRVVVDGTKLL